MFNSTFQYNFFQINSLKNNFFGIIQAKMENIKKSLFRRDLNDILFSTLRTVVKDWSIFSDFKD